MKIVAGATLLYALLGLVFATQGRPLIDEGMYLGAARRVAEGEVPYRDFPFAQAPMLPYVYAAAPTWDGSALLGGRLVSWLAAVAGMAAALWLARRVAGDVAAVFTLLLTAATLPCLWVATSVRTQAVGTPLLVLGVAALARQPRGVLGWSLAPSLLLWSSGMRLTNLGVLALVALWTAWRLRAAPRRLAGVAALVGAQALLAFLPALVAPARAWFQVFTLQLTRGERIGYIQDLDLAGELARKLGAYLDLTTDATVLLGAAGVVALGWLVDPRRRGPIDMGDPFSEPRSAQLALAGLGLVAFAPHLALGNSFPEYLTPLWALLAPAAGIGLAVWLGERPVAIRWAACAGLAALAAIPFASQRDTWIGREGASMASFRRGARELGASFGPGCRALTFHTHLAVEAGCRVLPGLEFSMFAYLPGLTSAEARRRGVLSRELLVERAAGSPPHWIGLSLPHPRLLLGARVELRDGRLRIPRVAPLGFLGPEARNYVRRRVIEIPTGVRRAGEPNTVPVSIYERRDRSPSPAGSRGRR